MGSKKERGRHRRPVKFGGSWPTSLAQAKALAAVGMNEEEYVFMIESIYKSAWASGFEKDTEAALEYAGTPHQARRRPVETEAARKAGRRAPRASRRKTWTRSRRRSNSSPLPHFSTCPRPTSISSANTKPGSRNMIGGQGDRAIGAERTRKPLFGGYRLLTLHPNRRVGGHLTSSRNSKDPPRGHPTSSRGLGKAGRGRRIGPPRRPARRSSLLTWADGR
jgi:hypothetical protein